MFVDKVMQDFYHQRLSLNALQLLYESLYYDSDYGTGAFVSCLVFGNRNLGQLPHDSWGSCADGAVCERGHHRESCPGKKCTHAPFA